MAAIRQVQSYILNNPYKIETYFLLKLRRWEIKEITQK